MAAAEDERAREAAAQAAESQEDLAQGGLPLQARQRLAQETGARPLFATGFDIGEFLLAGGAGYDAVGQVLGSSIYHVGWQWAPGLMSSELTVVTRAHMEARTLALGRMQREATALGAHGVVGVRLTTRAYEWGPGLLEFSATGTAVRLRGAPPAAAPFLSDLSGQDFWTLVQAGYLPRGLALGFCAYFVYNFGAISGFRNREVTSYSAGVSQARLNAMQRLEDDVRQLGAAGVVGVKVEASKQLIEGQNQPAGLQIEFLAVGTAVIPARQRPTPAGPPLVLNLTGLPPVRPRGASMQGAELQTS